MRDRGLASASDAVGTAAALDEQRVLITRDGDFTRMLAGSGKCAPPILLLRSVVKERPEEQVGWISKALRMYAPQLALGVIVVLEDDRTRVTPLPVT